jgi:hypothetical protein
MFIFISAGAAFVLLGFAPASDEFHSDDRTFTIYVTTPGSWESWRGSQRFDLASEDSGVRFTDGALVPGEKFFDNLSVQKWPGNTAGSVPIKAPKLFQRIRISLPESVSQRQDFSISIGIDRFGDTCAAGEQQFLLSSSGSASARTSDRCESLKVPDGFSGACAMPSRCSLRVTWDLTPTESGSLIFTVSLPKSASIVPADINEPWEGYMIDSASPLWRSVKTFKPGSSVMTPLYRGDDFSTPYSFSLDVARQQLRIPMQIVTTLGMTRGTYEWVALLGTCISAFLGTGWLWQILTAMRSRQQEKKQGKTILITGGR